MSKQLNKWEKKINVINLGEYNEDDFSSRNAMCSEIDKDGQRVLEAKEEGKRELAKDIKNLNYLKMYLGKNVADRKYKVYLKAEIDCILSSLKQ
jgi:hypothetical protein